MSTVPTTPDGAGTSGAGPTLPLTPDARKAYIDLYNKAEAAIQGTIDVDLLQSLHASQDAIGAVISADNSYRLNRNTAAFQTLAKQIDTANTSLKQLQADIGGIASKISVFSDVAAGITKVLGFVGV